MTLSELKKSILQALYQRYKENKNTSIGIHELCSSNSIVFDSDGQLLKAVEGLKKDEYIRADFLTGNNVIINDITSDGIEYVENNILSEEELVSDGLMDTDKHVKEGHKISLDIEPSSEEKQSSPSSSEIVLYNSQECYEEYRDSAVPPCFNVNSLAECYVRQLDKIAEHTYDNFCMLGIFGPWGRGKTYFFQRVKKILNSRLGDNKTKQVDGSKIRYKIIEFNAWKYQDTPAIWAYLYETIYHEGLKKFWRRLFDLKYILAHQWLPILSTIVCLSIAGWLYSYISKVEAVPEGIKAVMNALKIPLYLLTPLSVILYNVIKNPFSIHNAIERYFKRKSYTGILGIQNDLEHDLESLIKFIVCKRRVKKEQIILFVDDIDRSDASKMLNIVNSLRLILENREIQKRVIVICSIDVDKFIMAYCHTKSYEQKNNEDLIEEAKEHLDKLFIFSIGLPQLNVSQQIEYLEKLSEPKKGEKGLTKETPYRTSSEKQSLFAFAKDPEIKDLTVQELSEFLMDYLKEHGIIGMTPRKIRIIYYRLLYANSIIAAGGGRITDRILEMIISRSVKGGITVDTNLAYSDVISLVTPY